MQPSTCHILLSTELLQNCYLDCLNPWEEDSCNDYKLSSSPKKSLLKVKSDDELIWFCITWNFHLCGIRSHRCREPHRGLREQIKYCFIQIFFSSIQQESINNKMCINKYEDRIVHYCVATVSKYITGWVHLQVKSSQSVHVRPAGKRDLGCSLKTERVVWRKWCFGSVATIQSSLESETHLMLSGDYYIHFLKTKFAK